MGWDAGTETKLHPYCVLYSFIFPYNAMTAHECTMIYGNVVVIEKLYGWI